jgi:hypothetical protein
MTPERNRLASFFYLLTRDSMPWGELHRLIDAIDKPDEREPEIMNAVGFALAEAAVSRLFDVAESVDTKTLPRTPEALRLHLAAARFNVEIMPANRPVYPPGQVDRIELTEGPIVILYASGKALVQGVGPLGVVRELVRENGWSVSG